jgi:hypothetical protein
MIYVKENIAENILYKTANSYQDIQVVNLSENRRIFALN